MDTRKNFHHNDSQVAKQVVWKVLGVLKTCIGKAFCHLAWSPSLLCFEQQKSFPTESS